MQQSIQEYMQTLGQQAQKSAQYLATASTKRKNEALQAIHDALISHKAQILAANAVDMNNGQANQLDAALLDRLELTSERFDGMLDGLKDVMTLKDPIGEITDMSYRPSGIQLGKMRVPLGVVGMIYESRPNVTLEAASLAIKSGNAIILRGGSEALASNQAIAEVIQNALTAIDFPTQSVQVVATSDRAAVGELITLTQYVDVIIPRGGKGLIQRISEEARIPVIKHLDGNCHVYIDAEADFDKAIPIAVNAKTHRYGVCNAMETLLVDQAIAADFLPRVAPQYLEKQVQLRGCAHSQRILGSVVSSATEADWETEYLAPILAIKVVADMDDAITHINHYGSHHTDAIVTENFSKAHQFLARVDSSSVIINASTRFADGFEYGLGAEIGISTDKIHARGPVGLEGLTSQKWIVFGHGEIRQ